jgi:uncharacterized protein YndB with AHSA1/START domain
MSDPIVVDQVFDSSVEKLWNAITDRNQMVQWYFEQISSFEPVVGHKTEFTVTVEDRDFVHQWEVTEVIPQNLISYSWKYKGIAGAGAVTWALSEKVAGSALRFTCTGVETFPQDDPLFTREAGENGWRYFINDRLKSFLDG